MNELKLIKQKILKENRLEELLDHMGCENFNYEQRGQLIVCKLPQEFRSKNNRSLQVRLNDSLTSHIRSRGVKGDIFTLVSYIVNKIPASETQNDLKNAKEWVIEILGYYDIQNGIYQNGKTKEINGWLKEIRKKRNVLSCNDIKPNEPISEKIKNQYIMYPYHGWIEEGISWDAQMEFEVGYDLASDRVVTMIRDSKGHLIGVKGRYVGDNEFILNEKKYLYLHKMNKSVELFNLHRALNHILECRSVIVFEGYKSIMKCYDIGIYNAVSIEGDDISPVQVSLLKGLGIDIDIILAFDKDRMVIPVDKETGEIIENYPPPIMEQARKLTNRKVFALIDKWNLLKDKSSPIDEGKEIFTKLYKNKSQLPIVNIFGQQ